jgi:hypothetical protein
MGKILKFYCRGNLWLTGAEDNLLDQLCGEVGAQIMHDSVTEYDHEFASGKLTLSNGLQFSYEISLDETEDEWVMEAELIEDSKSFDDFVNEAERRMFDLEHFKKIGKGDDTMFQVLVHLQTASQKLSLAATLMRDMEEIPSLDKELLRSMQIQLHQFNDNIGTKYRTANKEELN